jgi:hypothetical protein
VRVLVFGAGGELGARVCRLAAEVEGAEVLGASRSARGLAGVPMQRADVTDGASVARLLAAGDLVVNCVGPFHYDPTPLVAACIEAHAHYCDLADDVAFAERAREAAGAHGAHAAGVFVCTGASTVPGTLGLLAREFERSPRAHEIARVSAYLSVGSANPVSAGLLASLLAPLGREAPGGARWFHELRALSTRDGRTLRFGSYPAAFPAGSVALAERRVAARFFFGFDRAALTALLRLAAPALGRLPERSVAALARGLVPFANALRAFGTPRGLVALIAEDAAGRELARIELAASERGLDIPAAPPAWLAGCLVRGEALPSGALELAELVAASDGLGWLRSRREYTLAGVPG